MLHPPDSKVVQQCTFDMYVTHWYMSAIAVTTTKSCEIGKINSSEDFMICWLKATCYHLILSINLICKVWDLSELKRIFHFSFEAHDRFENLLKYYIHFAFWCRRFCNGNGHNIFKIFFTQHKQLFSLGKYASNILQPENQMKMKNETGKKKRNF